jgi:hypothetical protein
MTRPRAWVLNLDAELELARARPGYSPPRRLERLLGRHRERARALLGPRDVIAGEASPCPGAIGRAWSPTPRALDSLRRLSLVPEPHPSPAVLHRVNHRRFVCELGPILPGRRYVESREALADVLSGEGKPWLLKRPLSFAGRGQLRLHQRPTPPELAWIAASFERDGLLLEPLVQIELELSLHGFIQRSGTFELGRLCIQDVGPRGDFRGARLALAGELCLLERERLEQQGDRVARALHAAGYFGPFGIDAYRYTTPDGSALCSLSEINARYTLSFAVGFPRHTSELEP